jgi:hypothetical protein
MPFFKRHYKKLILLLILVVMFRYPNYFWGAIGLFIAAIVIGLLILEIALDVYIVWVFLRDWYREKRQP